MTKKKLDIKDILAYKFYLEAKVKGMTFHDVYIICRRMEQHCMDSKMGVKSK